MMVKGLGVRPGGGLWRSLPSYAGRAGFRARYGSGGEGCVVVLTGRSGVGLGSQ